MKALGNSQINEYIAWSTNETQGTYKIELCRMHRYKRQNYDESYEYIDIFVKWKIL